MAEYDLKGLIIDMMKIDLKIMKKDQFLKKRVKKLLIILNKVYSV